MQVQRGTQVHKMKSLLSITTSFNLPGAFVPQNLEI